MKSKRRGARGALVRGWEENRENGKTADPRINYVRNVAAASTNCFAFRSSLFRARLTGDRLHSQLGYVKKNVGHGYDLSLVSIYLVRIGNF